MYLCHDQCSKKKVRKSKHGLTDFRGSNGWLEKNFGKEITYLSNQFEVKQQVLTKKQSVTGKQKYPTLLTTPITIFSSQTRRTIFRVLPNKAMAFKKEMCSGGKISKERLTVLLCSNMLGEFEKPLVIGKAKQPRAFKKLDINNFPIDWCWNKKAWMTTAKMSDWLLKFDKKMKKK